jgi:hypothetical protein
MCCMRCWSRHEGKPRPEHAVCSASTSQRQAMHAGAACCVQCEHVTAASNACRCCMRCRSSLQTQLQLACWQGRARIPLHLVCCACPPHSCRRGFKVVCLGLTSALRASVKLSGFSCSAASHMPLASARCTCARPWRAPLATGTFLKLPEGSWAHAGCSALWHTPPRHCRRCLCFPFTTCSWTRATACTSAVSSCSLQVCTLSCSLRVHTLLGAHTFPQLSGALTFGCTHLSADLASALEGHCNAQPQHALDCQPRPGEESRCCSSGQWMRAPTR